MKHICPPSNVLHVANLTQNVDDTVLLKTFGSFGTVTKVILTAVKPHQTKIVPGTPKNSAYVEMSSVDEAVDALVTLNHTQVEDSPPVRVSFTKLSRIL